jgi:hypothetical protein
VSQEHCARHREDVPYVNVYRYKPKYRYPKLNVYGYNGQRRVRPSGGSTYCTCSADALSHPAHIVGLDPNAQSAKLNQYFNTAGFHVMYSAWNPKDNYSIGASVYIVQFNGFVTHMLITY